MEKIRVYISGNDLNIPEDEVWQKFEKAEFRLLKRNFEAMNPVRIIANQLQGSHDTRQNIMRLRIQILACCDEVYFLPDWKDSADAKLEHAVAEGLGIQIIYCQD